MGAYLGRGSHRLCAVALNPQVRSSQITRLFRLQIRECVKHRIYPKPKFLLEERTPLERYRYAFIGYLQPKRRKIFSCFPENTRINTRSADVQCTRLLSPTALFMANVIFFGETGSGKSSLVNMILGYEAASTSNATHGCTFQSAAYNTSINGVSVTLHDTSGLDEGEQGRVPHADAIVQLYSLLKRLEGGLSLLVFVLKAPARIRDSTRSNWRLFTEVMCQRAVPTAVVITGLEQEANMDAWWPANQEHFRMNEIYPSAHACVTTIKGKMTRSGSHILQEEYDQSRRRVQDLISYTRRYVPWRMQTVEWLNQVVYETYYESRACRSSIEKKRAVDTIRGAQEDLIHRCGMSRADAESLARRLSNV